MGKSVGGLKFRPPCRARLLRSTVSIACDIVVPAKAGTRNHRRQFEAQGLNQQIAEITPLGIVAFDQLDLPVTLSTF